MNSTVAIQRACFVSAHAAVRYIDRVMGLRDECTRAATEVLAGVSDTYNMRQLDSDTLKRIEVDNGLDDVRQWIEQTEGLREAVALGATCFVADGVRYVIQEGRVVTIKTIDMAHLSKPTETREPANG